MATGNPKGRSLKLRTTPYPTREQLQPFINSHEKLTNGTKDETSPVELDPLSSRIPFNAETLRRGEAYRSELPQLLDDRMHLTQEFFLKDVSPYLLACANGLQNAHDVLRSALQEDNVEVDHLFSKIENAVGLAMDVRILNFAMRLADLNREESRQFLLLSMSKEMKMGEDTISTLMKEVLKLKGTPEEKARRKPLARKALAPVRGKKPIAKTRRVK